MIAVSFYDLCVKYYWIHYFKNCHRGISLYAAILRGSAEIRIARCSEHVKIALSAKQNNALFNNGNTVKFLTSSAADTSLKGYLYIKPDVYREKAFVKCYRINGDVCPRNTRALYSYIASSFDYFITQTGEKNPYVFITVSVSAGVKNSVRLYANCLFAARQRSTRKSIIRHKIILPKNYKEEKNLLFLNIVCKKICLDNKLIDLKLFSYSFKSSLFKS